MPTGNTQLMEVHATDEFCNEEWEVTQYNLEAPLPLTSVRLLFSRNKHFSPVYSSRFSISLNPYRWVNVRQSLWYFCFPDLVMEIQDSVEVWNHVEVIFTAVLSKIFNKNWNRCRKIKCPITVWKYFQLRHIWSHTKITEVLSPEKLWRHLATLHPPLQPLAHLHHPQGRGVHKHRDQGWKETEKKYFNWREETFRL